MALGSPFYNVWLRLLGAKVSNDALLLTAITAEHDMLTVEQGACVDKEEREGPRSAFHFPSAFTHLSSSFNHF